MDVRGVTPTAPGPQGLDALAATAAPAPVREDPPPSNVLDPPVKIDIGTSAPDTRFVRDVDTRSLVFQFVDPGSGDVIAQLPTETVLRNRAYNDSERARSAQPGSVSRVA